MLSSRFLRFILLSAYISTVSGAVVVLAQSGLKSIISSPGSPRPAAFVNYKYPHNLSAVPSARWIWDGTGDTPTCYMNITVEQDFILKCLGQPMTVYIAADNKYTSTILGVTGKGNNWAKSQVYLIPTTGIACKTKIKLTMYAENTPMGGKVNCKDNPAALVYAVTTNDCPCATGYFYNNDTCLCDYCQNFIPGCSLCDSPTHCLDCNVTNNWQLQLTACQCINSYTFMLGCVACILPGDPCPACYTNLLFVLDSNGVCVCQSGYVLDTMNQCKSCWSFIPHCEACVAMTVCIQCGYGFFLNGPTVCSPVCGDGLLREPEECDDGNTQPGDGCSAGCKIETDFLCDTLVEPSQCSYTKPLIINNYTVLKDPTKNNAIFTLDLGDNWNFFKNCNFSEIITNNGSLADPTYQLLDNGTLVISYNFTKNLEGSDVQFVINPMLDGKTIYKFTPQSFFLASNMTSLNNIPLRTFTDDLYQKQKGFELAYKFGIGVSYAVLFFGMLTDKVIGIQLFGAWQVAFFSLSTVNKVQPLLSPLLNLSTVNGINSAFNFGLLNVPERVAAINYSAAFLENCNYTVGLVFLDVILGVGLLIAGSFIPTYREKFKSYGRRLLKEFFIMLVAFNTLNISYSAGLEFTYNKSILGIVFASLCLTLPLIAMVMIASMEKTDFGEFVGLFKTKDCTKQRYIVFAIMERLVLGLLMSQLNEIEEATIISFFVGIIFMVYLWGSLPFEKTYHNYRSIIAQLSVLSGLLMGMYYRSMKSTTPIIIRTAIVEPAYCLIISLFVCLAISAASLVYELYLKYSAFCRKAIPVEKTPTPEDKLPERIPEKDRQCSSTLEDLSYAQNSQLTLSKLRLQTKVEDL